MNVFELEASLKLNTKDYKKALEDAEKSTKDASKELESLEGSADDAYSSLSSLADIADTFADNSSDVTSSASDISGSFDDIAGSADGAAESIEGIGDSAETSADDTETAFSGVSVDVDVSPAEGSLGELVTEAQSTAEGVKEPFSGGFDGIAEDAAGMVTNVSGTMGGFVQAIATGGAVEAFQAISQAVLQIAEDAIEMQESFYESQEIIVQGTGAMGDALEGLKQQAKESWAAIAGESVTLEESSATTANISTRLGLDEATEQSKALNDAFLAYGETLGTSASGAVNDFVDVLRTWGYSTEDIVNNQGVLYGMMDEFTVATQSANISSSELAGVLSGKSVEAFKEMGYSMDDTIRLVTGYVDAGGNASDLTSKMSRAYNTLAKEMGPEGAAGAMNEIMTAMQSGASASDILTTSISGTDKTMADLFGGSASEMISRFQNMTSETERLNSAFDAQTGKMAETYAGTLNMNEGYDLAKKKAEEAAGVFGGTYYDALGMVGGAQQVMAVAALDSAADTVASTTAMAQGAELLKTTYNDASAAANATAEGTKATADATADLATSAQNAAASTQTSADAVAAYADTMENDTASATDSASKDIKDVSSDISTETNKAESSVDSSFSAIEKDITSAMNTAKTNVSSAVSEMRNTLSTTLKGPNIQVPHFSMTGDFDAKTKAVPSVSVSWYAKAMQNAALFSQPSVIGAGEAGNELLTGEQHLQSTVQTAVASAMSGVVGSIYDLLAQYLPRCADSNVYIDGKQLTDTVSRNINRNLRNARAY